MGEPLRVPLAGDPAISGEIWGRVRWRMTGSMVKNV